jgi:hypothetical protein
VAEALLAARGTLFEQWQQLGLVVTCLPKVPLRKARYFNGL